MKGNPADWQQALSAVHGIIIRGEERITTQELLAEHLGVPATDRAARFDVLCVGWDGARGNFDSEA
jgi:hypothetical protein